MFTDLFRFLLVMILRMRKRVHKCLSLRNEHCLGCASSVLVPKLRLSPHHNTLSTMSENTENLSYKANRPVGYSIEFEPDKPPAPVPKCVLEYSSKPAPSPRELQEKLTQAALRKKVRIIVYVYI